MTAPNIEMIAASLQSCTLSRSIDRAAHLPLPPPLIHDHDDHENHNGVLLELNSDVALPYPWEQCLDITTGEVYYINWRNGTRTAEDPRTFAAYHPFAYYSESEDDTADEDEDGDADAGEGDTASWCSSGASSSLSSSSPPPSPPPQPSSGGATLVAAGCRACFMYFMVPKQVLACPRCDGMLFHLGRNGCF